MKIKEYYEKISKKKGLPSYKDFDSEFDIGSIEEGNFAMQIAEKIAEKVEKFRKMIEEFLHTDGSSLAVLMEIKGMDEKDKEKMNSIYKELMIIERNFLLVELENKEGSFLDFIKQSIDKWSSVKPWLNEIIKKGRDSWKDTSKVKEELGYLG